MSAADQGQKAGRAVNWITTGLFASMATAAAQRAHRQGKEPEEVAITFVRVIFAWAWVVFTFPANFLLTLGVAIEPLNYISDKTMGITASRSNPTPDLPVLVFVLRYLLTAPPMVAFSVLCSTSLWFKLADLTGINTDGRAYRLGRWAQQRWFVPKGWFLLVMLPTLAALPVTIFL
jgi:hypothetical protein